MLPADRYKRYSLGFTLIELLVVLAIMSLSVVLIALWRPGGNTALADEASITRLVAALRQARTAALLTSQPTEFRLDPWNRRWQVQAVGSKRTIDGKLPPRIALRVTSQTAEIGAVRVATIRFLPDGSCTGAEIHLADGNWRRMIDVNWLTGRITSGQDRSTGS